LELIGDHRQLPAFVQNYWFNFEMNMPWLKRSLFERLVTENNVNHTILDEQRRMCPAVADMTRGAYQDLVVIVDHQVTIDQKIGDKFKQNLNANTFKHFEVHQAIWHGKGSKVPGSSKFYTLLYNLFFKYLFFTYLILCKESNIFFWDICNSQESKSSEYGASVNNKVDAEYVVALAKWFLLCGCPPSTITIITPYNGQLKCINNVMKSNKCPQMQVVTIDKFQGDENDIIILSMVRTTRENKFLLLASRFIVAMSRARLGLFIVGS
jgi:superfamily I DNA and/or RNA helicase